MSAAVLANVVLARMLTPREFGDFVVICSIASCASLVAMFGLNSAVVRFVGERLAIGDLAGARRVLGLCLRLATGLTFCVALVVLGGMANWGSTSLNLEHPGQIAFLTACSLALLAFYNLFAAALRGLGEMRFSSLLGGQQGGGSLGNLLFFVAVLGSAAYARLSLGMALSAYVASFSVALMVAGLWLSRTVVATFAGAGATQGGEPAAPLTVGYLVTTCFPALLVQVLTMVVRQGDLWVAGAWCSSEELALYAGASRAIQLVSIPLSLINLSVMSFIPQLRTHGRLPDLEHILQITAGWAAIPSFLALLAYVFAPAPILELFLGSYYRDAARLLAIMSFGQFVLVWVGSSELTLVLSGRERAAAVVNAVAAGAIVGGGALAARLYGAVGLAGVSAVVIAMQSLAQWLLARHLVGVWTHAAPFWRLKGVSQSI
jgi:O-antigen/teichoic acid export membrane protein